MLADEEDRRAAQTPAYFVQTPANHPPQQAQQQIRSIDPLAIEAGSDADMHGEATAGDLGTSEDLRSEISPLPSIPGPHDRVVFIEVGLTSRSGVREDLGRYTMRRYANQRSRQEQELGSGPTSGPVSERRQASL